MTKRTDRLVPELLSKLEDLSGLTLEGADPALSFIELGLDSLVLTQVAIDLQRTYQVKLTFRQLLEEVTSPKALAEFLDSKMPAEAAAPAPAPMAVAAPAPVAQQPAMQLPQVGAFPAMPQMAPMAGGPNAMQAWILGQQMALSQMMAMSGMFGGMQMPQVAPAPAPVAAPAPAPVIAAKPAAEESAGSQIKYDVKKAFGAIARIKLDRDEFSPTQRAKMDALTARYNKKTKSSKDYTQNNRAHLADPRVVTGFRPAVKELIYQIVIKRSKGSHLWDIDGNEYVDALNGFGSSFFGNQPDFIVDALKKQIDEGYEIGPQHPLAGEVAKLFCELTGADRAGLCNTGSEAVMGCMRIARTVTGRDTIAIFTGSYHGIFDEVLVRAGKNLRSMPAAPGILSDAVKNVLVLDYGTEESLKILRERAHELAAIMVEPIQSRRPDFQPREFIHECRKITEEAGAAFIFDEVITGFRTAQNGAQEFYGVRADLASYGKVVGGGQSIGVIAGKRKWMDALDGGHWQYGDASVPSVGVTYFAGTFVRHPLALAAAKASLLYMKEKGPELQRSMNAKTTAFADRLNAHFEQVGAPVKIKHFASLWKTFLTEDLAHGDLLFCFLRDRGVHIWDGFPCFLTTAHSEADVGFIEKAFKEAVAEMQEGGFFPPRKVSAGTGAQLDANRPPVPGARLGKDPQGNPAWFVPNPNEPGKYLKLDP